MSVARRSRPRIVGFRLFELLGFWHQRCVRPEFVCLAKHHVAHQPSTQGTQALDPQGREKLQPQPGKAQAAALLELAEKLEAVPAEAQREFATAEYKYIDQLLYAKIILEGLAKVRKMLKPAKSGVKVRCTTAH